MRFLASLRKDSPFLGSRKGKAKQALPVLPFPYLIYPEAAVIPPSGRNLFLNLKITAIIKRNLYLKIQGNTGGSCP
jgi:hypothetical protein